MPRPRPDTAGAHLNSRPRKASTGSGRRRLPECAPATRMHLICAVRVAFNRYPPVTGYDFGHLGGGAYGAGRRGRGRTYDLERRRPAVTQDTVARRHV